MACFFFSDTATTEIYTLSLHAALPICDDKSLSIAAASIVAKVTRDRIMASLAATFPGYGWERNAGYGTKEHQVALAALGVTPVHRKSYAPIRKILGRSEERRVGKERRSRWSPYH